MVPFSTYVRPERLEDFIGQEHFLKRNALVYNAIKEGRFESAVFYGPSGTGKTTLARIIAKMQDDSFIQINAADVGISELKKILAEAKDRFYGIISKSTYLYVDEIHRWNKSQQDSLLSALEEGYIKVIASTTENPFFEINNQILSRIRNIYEFKSLANDDIVKLLKRGVDIFAGDDRVIDYDEDALMLIAEKSNGDARIALDTLGFILNSLKGEDRITEEKVYEITHDRQYMKFNKLDDKYNVFSALHKSMRGSDPDAAVHYLARLLQGREDVKVIGRRLLVAASEDVGLAYPQVIGIVRSCVEAAHMLGMPEARIPLSQAVVLISLAPKSRSTYNAINSAIEEIKTGRIDDVPDHIRNFHNNNDANRPADQFLPDNLYKKGVRYYVPSDNGLEKDIYSAYLKFKKGSDDE